MLNVGSLRRILVHRASVQLEGLQHWLRYSADVVLVVAESCKDPGRVHVLDVSIVAVGVSVHVSQFTYAIKRNQKRMFQIHKNEACTSHSSQDGLRSTGVPLLTARTSEDVSRSSAFHKLDDLHRSFGYIGQYFLGCTGWTQDIQPTLFPAPPTLTTSWGSMASTQSVTTLLLWERVVVMMRLSPRASCSWNPKVPKPGIPHMVLPKSAPAPSWADTRDYRGFCFPDVNWFSYLIVVERLVDDTCDGFTSMSNTNQDSHIVQEAW